jgi:hypothetical protein
MADTPTSTNELIQHIDAAWAELQAGMADLTEEQLNTPDDGGWSIKDNLAHLSAWEHYMIATHLGGAPITESHNVDEATVEAGEDAINAAIQQRSRDRSATEIRAEAERVHAETMQTLRAMPFADLLKPRFADDPEQRPMLNWVIGNTYHHYQEHGAYIQKQLKRLTS